MLAAAEEGVQRGLVVGFGFFGSGRHVVGCGCWEAGVG